MEPATTKEIYNESVEAFFEISKKSQNEEKTEIAKVARK